MELLFDLLAEFILEGSVEVLGSKKAPLALRIAAAVVLVAVFLGLIVFFFAIGITDKNPVMLVLAVVFLLVFVVLIRKFGKKIKER
jgi:peptidoglycan/LPS O-acetylase OafA/YrhL